MVCTSTDFLCQEEWADIVKGHNLHWEWVLVVPASRHACGPLEPHLRALPSVTMSMPFPMVFQGICVVPALRLSWPANLISQSFWKTVPSGKSMVVLTFGIENICHVTFTLKDSQRGRHKTYLFASMWPFGVVLKGTPLNEESLSRNAGEERRRKEVKNENVHIKSSICGYIFPALNLGPERYLLNMRIWIAIDLERVHPSRSLLRPGCWGGKL